jgi:hypothetical protein
MFIDLKCSLRAVEAQMRRKRKKYQAWAYFKIVAILLENNAKY